MICSNFLFFRSETASERPTSPQSFKESIYETLPKSLRETQLVVKEIVEDQDLVKERQELTRTKSPADLSQISSIADFPVPATIENLLKSKRYVFQNIIYISI